MPSDESESTYISGDLYDILSGSSEIRFHAGHLFLRYFSLVGHPTGSTAHDEDAEAFESVAWDIAVACLAISVKVSFSLYPVPLWPLTPSSPSHTHSSTATSSTRLT